MRRSIQWVSLLAVVIMVGAAEAAEAQGNCFLLTYGCEGGAQNHYATGSEAAIGKPEHTDCRLCPGQSINECHDSCGGSSLPPMTKAAVASALRAAEKGDVATLFALSAVLGDRLRFNEERGALQIMSCTDESVVASLRLTTSQRVAAVALPRAGTTTSVGYAAPDR